MDISAVWAGLISPVFAYKYINLSQEREIRIMKMPVRLMCDQHCKGHIIGSSDLVSPRTTAQTNGYCIYVNICRYIQVFVWKQKSFINFQCFVSKNGWVELDQKQRKLR